MKKFTVTRASLLIPFWSARYDGGPVLAECTYLSSLLDGENPVAECLDP
jgi:hypothetical protein